MSAGLRRHAGTTAGTAVDRARMSLVRVCPHCHQPLRPTHASVEEDRFTGEPVTRYRYICDRCEPAVRQQG